ncbi:hypothetical protein DFH08DRAFT_504845 [Mycena albidolilacea]|uniref:Uncharacterized protein n=1 Tax=Mycena albidolilacea TaxID=1033008 RepID=A0AAD7ADM6_9AGAR|nr:hypothetical protein DFH08DRAFT_504845 [Mycena albidolilacea]
MCGSFRFSESVVSHHLYSASCAMSCLGKPKRPTQITSHSVLNQRLPPNPDISGLGVRISFFYVQKIAPVLLTARSLDEALNSVWTLLATSFGLTVSTLITATSSPYLRRSSSWLANCAIFMALATYNRHPHGSHVVQYTAIGQMYVSMANILYLWARAPTLDAEFDQIGGETVFVVLFKKTSTTGAGRVLALVVIAVLVGYTVVAAIPLAPPCRHAQAGREDVVRRRAFSLPLGLIRT